MAYDAATAKIAGLRTSSYAAASFARKAILSNIKLYKAASQLSTSFKGIKFQIELSLKEGNSSSDKYFYVNKSNLKAAKYLTQAKTIAGTFRQCLEALINTDTPASVEVGNAVGMTVSLCSMKLCQ